jgi:hypothetical protein
MAMGINGERADQRSALTHHALDRRADLPAQQGERLIIENAPLIENGLIDAHAVDPALRIDPRIVQVFAGIETHQIRGGFVPCTPVIDDAVATRELQQRVVRVSHGGLRLKQAHVAPNRAFMDTADHAGDTPGFEIGAGREQCAIDAEQFLGMFRLSSQELPAEVHPCVELEQQGWQLYAADIAI